MADPVLFVAADSVNRLHSAGDNSLAGHGFVDPATGVPFDDTNSTVFVTITPGTVVNQAAASWVAATVEIPYARWEYIAPATATPRGQGPWLLTFAVYGLLGLSDTHQSSFYYSLEENEAARR